MESESLLLYSQNPTINPYIQQIHPSPHIYILFS
jgi:hypothetical protein